MRVPVASVQGVHPTPISPLWGRGGSCCPADDGPLMAVRTSFTITKDTNGKEMISNLMHFHVPVELPKKLPSE